MSDFIATGRGNPVDRIEIFGTPDLSATFKLLGRSGANRIVAYGGFLSDIDHGLIPTDYDMIAQFTRPDWFAVQMALEGQFRQPVTRIERPGTTPRFHFNHAGRKIDLGVTTEALDTRDIADCATIGLRAIAMDTWHRVYASTRYLSDRSARTLTLVDGLNAAENATALAKAQELQHKKFPQYTIVQGRLA
jgi:hypothetical protein